MATKKQQDTEKDPLAGLDLDALAKAWATPSHEGGWGEPEARIYDSLDPDAQTALKAELERRTAKG